MLLSEVTNGGLVVWNNKKSYSNFFVILFIIFSKPLLNVLGNRKY